MQNQTTIIKVFDAVTILAAGTALSEVSDVNLSGGIFSLQMAITGNGTLKAEIKMSNNGTDYLIPEGALPIMTGLTKTSGPGADGKVLKGFTTDLASYAKIFLTETGGLNTVTISGWLAVQ
jgi:hypothetical protein